MLKPAPVETQHYTEFVHFGKTFVAIADLSAVVVLLSCSRWTLLCVHAAKSKQPQKDTAMLIA